MLYKIRIVSDEVDDFRRDILIDSESTFEQFKDAICSSVGYNPNQMSSFFICNDDWEKEKEITLEDMGADVSKDLYLMADTELEDLIDDVGQKLLFTFDYMSDRSFFLQVKDEIFDTEIDGPQCVKSEGEAPQQTMPFEEFEKIVEKSTTATPEVIDEDFLNSDSYDIDEIADLDEMDY